MPTQKIMKKLSMKRNKMIDKRQPRPVVKSTHTKPKSR